MERILCVYATRQIDSNLMMASTVFRGLREAGYDVDMIFIGSSDAIIEFKQRYAKYFNGVFYKQISRPLKEIYLHKKSPLLYSYLRSFLMDGFNSPRVDWLKGKIRNNYDKILSFIPPVISGRYALKVKEHFLRTTPLIQFWTDPLSLGRLNGINEIPRERWLHKYLENRVLNGGGVSKIVFCYPLLMAMEASLHPDAAHKMTWSDVSFMPHKNQTMHVNQRPIIGLFGAYQQHVRNIRPLLEAIQELPDFDFIIRGDGDLPFDISGITNLDLKSGRIPLTEVEELEDKCDVLLSLAGKSGITHPAGKTFYYADYKKPIIHIGDGKHALYFKGYLDEFGSRFIHCFNSKEEIKNSINEAVNKAKEFTLIIPERMDASLIVRKILDL